MGMGEKRSLMPKAPPTLVQVRSEFLERNLLFIGPYVDLSTPCQAQCLVCEAIVFPRLNNLRNGRGGCRPCGYITGGKSRRTSEDQARCEFLEAGLLLVGTYTLVTEKVECVCLNCGDTVYPKLDKIRRGFGGCGACRYEKISSALTTSRSAAVDEFMSAGITLLGGFSGVDDPCDAQCACGEYIRPRLSGVREGRRYCRVCRRGGFSPESPYVFYILRHTTIGAGKYGITMDLKKRFIKLRPNGWDTASPILFSGLGRHVLAQETAIKRWLRSQNHPTFAVGNGSGYTETFKLEILDELLSLVQLNSDLEEVHNYLLKKEQADA